MGSSAAGAADVTRSLFIVRGKEEERYWYGHPLPTKARFRLEGVFPTRAEAEAFQAEREREAATSGDPGPLLDRGPHGLLALTAFEPAVFRDWLTDHGIPDPETF